MNLDQFYLLLCGFLGVCFHSLVKYRTLRQDANKANMSLLFSEYVLHDWPALIMSVLSVLIWYFVFKEVAAKYKGVAEFSRVSFVAMGGIGSWIIQTFMSRTKQRIREVIDKKTDIADGIPLKDE